MLDRQTYHRQYYLNNKERILRKNRKYNKEHRKEIQEQENARGLTEEQKRHKKNACLKRTYGIDLDIYDRMYSDQNGVCAICREPESRKSPKSQLLLSLLIDHNHQTNQVRALICHRCNTALGLFRDSPLLCRMAAEYLEKHSH